MNRNQRRRIGSKAQVRLGLEAKCAVLERRVAELERAFNTNTDAFSSGLTYADAMLWALRELATDMLNGKPVILEKDGEKTIDLRHYMLQYEEYLAAQNAKPENGRIVALDAEGPIVFGGA